MRELNGECRLTWDDVRPAKKEIYSTRSFSQRVTTPQELKQALSAHAETASNKLRAQQSTAGAISIFAANSSHDNAPYVKRHVFTSFVTPTNDTRDFNDAITKAMQQLFLPGVQYYKAGIGLLDLRNASHHQADLFANTKCDPALMNTLDTINQRYGNSTMGFAAKGISRAFDMKREFLSNQYTTKWSDIPKIKC